MKCKMYFIINYSKNENSILIDIGFNLFIDCNFKEAKSLIPKRIKFV